MKNCTNCGAMIKDRDEYCPFCNAVCEKQTEEKDDDPAIKAQQYPMKWHKFQLVLLIIRAVSGIIDGLITIVSGRIVTVEGLKDFTMVYSVYPGLENCFRYTSVMSIAMGIFAFIVWKRLRGYRANGPISFKIMLVLDIITGIATCTLMSSAMNTNLFSFKIACFFIAEVVLLIINSTYYARRSELFVK